MKIIPVLAVLLAVVTGLCGGGCSPTEPNELDQLGTVRITIAGQEFELWIADEPNEHVRGLMFVTTEQMAPLSDGTERGMLFVFDRDRHLSFWMKNTIVPLDVAYVDSDGIIVSIHTMAPLDDRYGQYPSGKPARYAIEVNADIFSELGVNSGDAVDIPETALKGSV